MLERIWVRGFRSLVDFSVDLTPGLNVAVGPNGAGKTNFIDFLAFAATLSRSGIHQAFASAGGVQSTFSYERRTATSHNLAFGISGKLKPFTQVTNNKRTEVQAVKFDYSCELSYRPRQARVYFPKEIVSLKFDGLPALTLQRKSYVDPDRPAILLTDNPEHELIRAVLHDYRFRDAAKDAEALPLLAGELDEQTSLLSTMGRYIHAIRQVASLIQGVRTINISPGAAKASSSVTAWPSMGGTGVGLAAVLFALSRGHDPARASSTRTARLESEKASKLAFSRIVSWIREANPQISKIGTGYDLINGEIEITADVGSAKGIPLRSLSDGTVKWAALVTLLSTADELQVIEEPENFLHPTMQEVFVKLCRELIADRDADFSMLVTTHSETLLNLCQPSELLMFEVGDDGTTCRRTDNAEAVVEQMQRTRFKLGQLYKIGALSGTTRRNS